MPARIASLLAASLLAPSLHAACQAQSGPQTAAVLELFTSEGCNSCPPADKFLSCLVRERLPAGSLIPLAFHVDYWDYIGWKDRFASPAYSERQRDYSRSGGTGFVYTPQFVLGGRDFRAGLSATRLRDAAAGINAQSPRAAIALSLAPAGRQFEVTGDVTVPAIADRRDAAVYLSLYENRLASEVKAGENAGVTLRHDYVVRDWVGPLGLDAAGEADLRRVLALKPGQKPEDSGVVALVQNRRTGEILQALQLPNCGG